MKILALEHDLPGTTSESFQHYAKEEAHIAWELYQAGVFRELYFRADRSEAVLMLECTSVEEAMEHLCKLPFVREGLIRFEVIPLKAYPGFQRLFAQE